MNSETKARMAGWRVRYLACRSADELSDLYDVIRDAEGFIFRDFVRDGFLAAAFARARGLDRVRLSPDQWPDFIVTENGLDFAYEAREADRPGRRRDAEFREIALREARGLPTVTADPSEDWLTPELASAWLTTAAAAKAGKSYPVTAGLAIYLNATDYGSRTDEILGVMSPATAVAKDAFVSVWVMWRGRALQCWADGLERSVRDQWPEDHL